MAIPFDFQAEVHFLQHQLTTNSLREPNAIGITAQPPRTPNHGYRLWTK
jgi:hypothetical protein